MCSIPSLNLYNRKHWLRKAVPPTLTGAMANYSLRGQAHLIVLVINLAQIGLLHQDC